MRRFDLYASPFNFVIENGAKSLKTINGSIWSLFLSIAVIIYVALKTNTLFTRGSVNVVSTVQDNFIKKDERFGPDKGFAIAAAWSANLAVTFDLDPSIGEMIFVATEWGYDENGEFKMTNTEIPSHKCSLEELGLEGTNHKFMPAAETSAPFL